MTDEKHRELQLVVELTAARLDLKFTEAIGALEKCIDEKLAKCQFRHEQRGRFRVGTWIQSIGIVAAVVMSAISLLGG